ncbi:MAG: hypothetical protein HY692_08675 [Cyanobacteria bacterium NC_groundwater_1444_Ag_S-0.65um_54_12]|nr:hypothetical protein [Cyanobacteria bacterium NC_groundwater_1444_Ag_S-0.65um_54_12]
MYRRELEKFEDPLIKEQYLEKYGDPLADVSPDELMELMEGLWASRSGQYAQLREALNKKGLDSWSARIELLENYFRNLYVRQNKLDEAKDKSRIQDVGDFISCRVRDLIKAHQEKEAAEAEHLRDPFGPRIRGW